MHDGRISDVCYVFRQYMESSVRAHRKHMASLHSTLKDVLDKKQTTKKSPSSSSSSQSAAGIELSLETGLHNTLRFLHAIQIVTAPVSHCNAPFQ